MKQQQNAAAYIHGLSNDSDSNLEVREIFDQFHGHAVGPAAFALRGVRSDVHNDFNTDTTIFLQLQIRLLALEHTHRNPPHVHAAIHSRLQLEASSESFHGPADVGNQSSNKNGFSITLLEITNNLVASTRQCREHAMTSWARGHRIG